MTLYRTYTFYLTCASHAKNAGVICGVKVHTIIISSFLEFSFLYGSILVDL